MFKWSPETIVSVIAITISAGGGAVTTAVHFGSNAEKFQQVEQNQVALGQKLDQHQQELADQKTHEATVEQKLDDMILRLDRIERKL